MDIHYITDIKYNTLIKSNLLTGSIFDGIDNKPYTIYQTRYNARIVIYFNKMLSYRRETALQGAL